MIVMSKRLYKTLESLLFYEVLDVILVEDDFYLQRATRACSNILPSQDLLLKSV